MAVNDDVMFGIYNELQTLRHLKQIELAMMVSKSNMRLFELESIKDMIANPTKYFADDKKEDKDE